MSRLAVPGTSGHASGGSGVLVLAIDAILGLGDRKPLKTVHNFYLDAVLS